MKKCPYCAEEILDEAVKCKHCGEFLNKKPAEKWYFKNSLIITLFICVGPFALPLVWFNPKYSRTFKIVSTVFALALTYLLTLVMTKSIQSIMTYYEELQSVLS